MAYGKEKRKSDDVCSDFKTSGYNLASVRQISEEVFAAVTVFGAELLLAVAKTRCEQSPSGLTVSKTYNSCCLHLKKSSKQFQYQTEANFDTRQISLV